MAATYDVVVLGLGGMGSAALAHLAARGVKVLGLEQFSPAHALGSSHGQSRIIRKAYFEDPAYVPLLLRAYELWEALERRTGRPLMLRTGGLMLGPEGSAVVEGSARSAREHGLAHEWLTAGDIRRRYPVMRPEPDEVAVFEADAGLLFPEACVLAHLEAAVADGAEARFGARVTGWEAIAGGGVRVRTDQGTVAAGRLVICAGAWLGAVAPELGLPLQVERNVMHWFEPAASSEAFAPDRFPIYLAERRGTPVFYGFPALPGEGVKVAFHHSGQITTPDAIDRQVSAEEVAAMRQTLAAWLPDAAGECLRSTACMYTNTPDEHFVIGLHPGDPNVVLAGGFSGHGFKFCSVVGEVLADLAMDGGTRHPVGLFRPGR
ncbi:MAG: dependent oxidoreductase [Firmicutes bacterium]|nr:dependent oxidoreductase [Bacillota bacterium]